MTTPGCPVARCYVRDPFGNRLELVDAADADQRSPDAARTAAASRRCERNESRD